MRRLQSHRNSVYWEDLRDGKHPERDDSPFVDTGEFALIRLAYVREHRHTHRDCVVLFYCEDTRRGDDEPPVYALTVHWKRDSKRVAVRDKNGANGYDIEHVRYHSHSFEKGRAQFTPNAWRARGDTVTFWPEGEAKVLEGAMRHFVKRDRDRDVDAYVSKAEYSVEKQWAAKRERDAYAKFLEEFGDPELWEGHQRQKGLSFRTDAPKSFRRALGSLVRRGEDVQGLCVREVYTRAGDEVPDDIFDEETCIALKPDDVRVFTRDYLDGVITDDDRANYLPS